MYIDSPIEQQKLNILSLHETTTGNALNSHFSTLGTFVRNKFLWRNSAHPEHLHHISNCAKSLSGLCVPEPDFTATCKCRAHCLFFHSQCKNSCGEMQTFFKPTCIESQETVTKNGSRTSAWLTKVKVSD